jgi:hypothetical protein
VLLFLLLSSLPMGNIICVVETPVSLVGKVHLVDGTMTTILRFSTATQPSGNPPRRTDPLTAQDGPMKSGHSS